jgi:two-component system chemotaxis response regulator CheB
MEKDNRKRGFSKMATSYREKFEHIQLHVDQMKAVLYASQKII